MKRRNREVNIFNMSLLDILCGALGAFCFMMLSLLPYYRPPGKEISISKQEKELLDEVQKIKDLAERLKNTSTAEDQRELVELLRKEIVRLENEIKKMQGQLNALYAENEELRTRVAKLEVENGILRTRNQQLEKEKQQILAEKQQLQREKEQLEQQKRQLENRLQEKLPWNVTVTANDARVNLDCSLHEQRIQATDNSRQADFDPSLAVQTVKWTGDFRMGGMGAVTRVNASRFVGGESKFYIKVNGGRSAPLAPGGRSMPLWLNTELGGSDLAPVQIPQVQLPPDRPWVYAGRFRVEALDRITYVEATPAEREAEWERLTNIKPPKTEEPVPGPELTDAVMGPGFEARKKEYESMTGGNAPNGLRNALLAKWQAEAQSVKEREYVGMLLASLDGRRREMPGPGPFPFPSNDPKNSPAAARRKIEYMRVVHEATTSDQKIAILRKWMNEADSDGERDQVRTILQQTNASPGSGPGPLSDRQRAIEEFKRQQQNQQQPPPK